MWSLKAFRKRRWASWFSRGSSGSEALATATELALRGQERSAILAASAEALLELGRAGRAGVWIEKSIHDTAWTGRVAQAGGMTPPESWLSVNPSAILHGRAPRGARSFVLHELEFPLEPVSFFDGMKTAMCLLLEFDGHLFGAALLASRRARLPSRRRILEDAASAIALALSVAAVQRQAIDAIRTLQVLAEIDQAIAGNSSPDQILGMMGVAIVRDTRAEFAGFARWRDSTIDWAALSGSESQAASSHSVLRDVASVAFQEQQPAIRAFPAEGDPSLWLSGMPLDPRNADSLLLLAGFRSDQEVPLDSLRQFADATIASCKTARSRLAAECSASEQRDRLAAEMQRLLDSVQCGVLLLDTRGYVRHANACLCDFLGLGTQQSSQIRSFDELAKHVEPLLRNPEAFAAPSRAFAQGSRTDFRDELALAGRNRRVLARDSRAVLAENGKPIGRLEIYRDITSQRQIDSKLVQTEKMAALGQLVSGIAHELNNPLTSIMGYAQLLLGRDAAAAQNAEAKMIFEEAERARRIVKNLLFFARRAEPEPTRVDVNEILERTIALRSYELKIENIAVSAKLAPKLPATLADPFQLQQVVLNLLINAEQAVLEGRGHGRIEIRTRTVSPSRIAIDVSDDGPGIPPDIASRIFDPFFTTKAPGVGTGLGLSIVYGIMEQHGGEVSFENLRGGGVKFTLELPVLAVPAAAFGPVADVAPRAVGSFVGRVLVIEDEPTVARLVADVLRDEGHEVETVLDSQEGLTRISRNSYDLIVSDLRMPRLDGPAFYDALVRTGSPARHRILFITGDTLGPRTVEFLKSHRLPFLAKPFLVEELKLAVNRILEGNANPDSHQALSTRSM
ncbi:MAG TPA: ATP-binding protein [Candidatus Acidoferrales bacterium]|nr:ATP-binding protein [Candidatus Acidoferrales bacterium]